MLRREKTTLGCANPVRHLVRPTPYSAPLAYSVGMWSVYLHKLRFRTVSRMRMLNGLPTELSFSGSKCQATVRSPSTSNSQPLAYTLPQDSCDCTTAKDFLMRACSRGLKPSKPSNSSVDFTTLDSARHRKWCQETTVCPNMGTKDCTPQRKSPSPIRRRQRRHVERTAQYSTSTLNEVGAAI